MTLHIGIAGPIATESIAHLLTSRRDLPPGQGGAPLLGTLITELLRRGHRVSAFTTSPGIPLSGSRTVTAAAGERFCIHYCAVRPHSFRPKHGRLGRAVDFFSMERDLLARAMLTAPPDVIHAHWAYEFGLAAIDSGLPHVVTCHDAPHKVLRYMPTLYRLVRYQMARLCLSRAKIVTAVSSYLQGEIQPNTDVPVDVVPNPIPDLLSLAQETGVRTIKEIRRPKFGMVANGWGKRKNAESALLAFKTVRAQIPGASLHLFGSDYGAGETADRWACRRGLSEGVVFRGSMNYLGLLRELGSTDICLSTSLEETFGMAIAEAMALGLPVVAGANSGAVPWLVGRSGLLVNVEAPTEVAAALVKLAEDRQLYGDCSAAAFSRSRSSFSASSVASEYEALYSRALTRD